MIAPEQILPPANWQDFESLCKKLWGDLWHTDSIKKNGKSGDSQNGVDIYAKVDGKYYGIQCKLKEQLTEKQLSKTEINAEIEKAKSFKPSMAKLIFATTTSKNADIEEYIRIKDDENSQQGLFEIELFSWEDIVDLLMESKSAYDWYVRNIYFDKGYKAAINFDGENEISFKPFYIRHTKDVYYIGPPYDCHDWHAYETTIQMLNKEMQKRNALRLNFCFENVGDSMIDHYKIEITCKDTQVRFAPIKYAISSNPLITAGDILTQVSPKKIYHTAPVNSGLVQHEKERFSCLIYPNPENDIITLDWKLLAKDYSNEGHLHIKLKPVILEILNIHPYYRKVDAPDGMEEINSLPEESLKIRNFLNKLNNN